ncbi:MAG: AMP-binding protein [Deltaproteobacteria bacterium]|nr:AMP-binding protein [Candidatus Zymogenaceae bacterium]
MSVSYEQKPWMAFYDDHVPEFLDYPEKLYSERFQDIVRAMPDAVAVYYMDRPITYRELNRYADRFANFIISRGLVPGDVVGVNLPNLPAYYIAIQGIMKAGCVLSGVSPLLTPKELEYQLNDSGAKILVTLDLLFGKAAEVVAKTGVRSVLVAGISDFLPPVKKFLGKLLKKIPTGAVTEVPGVEVIRYMEALAGAEESPVLVQVGFGAPCLMQYTGGTTGPPKGAVLTQKNVSWHVEQLKSWLNLDPGYGAAISAFPLFHQAGLFVGMLCMAMGLNQVAVPNPRDLGFIVKNIKKYKPFGIINVPTIFLELMKREDFRALDFSSVNWFVSGAAPFPADYIVEFEKIVGKNKLVEVMGMTETTPITTALPIYGKKKVGSVGIPISDTDVKVVDPATKEVVPVGEPGEMVVKGPQVFTIGYHNKPEETANTLRDGWIYTGDIVSMDEDGYFFVVDRAKDMLIVSGYKVFTRTVDDVLMEHDDIDMAATIGLPDPKRPGSELVASAIVLKKGVSADDAAKERIIAYMKEKVAPYKVPKVIEFMDELPMSAVGKILKRELRDSMAKKA